MIWTEHRMPETVQMVGVLLSSTPTFYYNFQKSPGG